MRGGMDGMRGGSLALLVGKSDREDDDGDGHDTEGPEDRPSDEETQAADDLLAAIRSRDAEGVALALRDFVESCMDSYDRGGRD